MNIKAAVESIKEKILPEMGIDRILEKIVEGEVGCQVVSEYLDRLSESMLRPVESTRVLKRYRAEDIVIRIENDEDQLSVCYDNDFHIVRYQSVGSGAALKLKRKLVSLPMLKCLSGLGDELIVMSEGKLNVMICAKALGDLYSSSIEIRNDSGEYIYAIKYRNWMDQQHTYSVLYDEEKLGEVCDSRIGRYRAPGRVGDRVSPLRYLGRCRVLPEVLNVESYLLTKVEENDRSVILGYPKDTSILVEWK